MNVGVIYSKNIEATKITSDWYLWIHHTVDKVPNNKDFKYSWQKKHLENQTGTNNSYKPIKIRKNNIKKKNMRLGNKIIIIFITYYSSMFLSFAEEKISTSSLLNEETFFFCENIENM